MRHILTTLALLALFSACSRAPQPFEFTFQGHVPGIESGHIYISESRRLGDEIMIPVNDHRFEYHGTADHLYGTMAFLSMELGDVFEFVVEPGVIEVELDTESMWQGSRVLQGPYNLAMQEARPALMERFAAADTESPETHRELLAWGLEHADNFLSISMFSTWVQHFDFFSTEQVARYLKAVRDPALRHSREFIELRSQWLAMKDPMNRPGERAADFQLADAAGDLVAFRSVSEGSLTYVEKSGSWCGNSTRESRQLLPLYERYRDQGLQIVTIVPESRHGRWLRWLEEEQLPWVNLVELDADVARRGSSLSEQLFREGNYLVDEEGTVLATGLTAALLEEELMRRFEPGAFAAYEAAKWEMPEGVRILDRDGPIRSLEELVARLGTGRPFLIDCWATWCSPCLEEFKHNDALKSFLAAAGVDIVYISFDRHEEETTWLRFLREQNLTGAHLRHNEELAAELMRQGFGGALPTYMIAGAGGEILAGAARRPSQGEALYRQIEETLNLNMP
jgi:thiol-disulfide isomerase/thioredoxin